MSFPMPRAIALASAMLLAAGCTTTETSRVIQAPQVAAAAAAYQGPRTAVSIGKFDNRSTYQRGVFSDGVDRLGGQARTILEFHLQQSGYFSVLNRDNLSELKQEAGLRQSEQTLRGARYVITGDVSEFGRKDVGDRQLFGILGRGKEQVAYARVNLNVVDVQTSEIVFSAPGAGEYALSSREIVGFGSTSGYDATLNGKVLDLAVREAVDNLAKGIQGGRWQPDARR